jgi:GxxExxY protein
LESVYKECLRQELATIGLSFAQECQIPLLYRGRPLQSTFRLDFLVEGQLILEIKAIEALTDVHAAQLLTYLRLSSIHLGLLINFNVIVLSKGIRRIINGYRKAEGSPL